MQPSFTTVIRGLTCQERTALGWCSMTDCTREPEITHAGLSWCRPCWALIEAQGQQKVRR